MFNNMFDPDWLQFISKASIVDIMKMFVRFNRFGLSQKRYRGCDKICMRFLQYSYACHDSRPYKCREWSDHVRQL